VHAGAGCGWACFVRGGEMTAAMLGLSMQDLATLAGCLAIGLVCAAWVFGSLKQPAATRRGSRRQPVATRADDDGTGEMQEAIVASLNALQKFHASQVGLRSMLSSRTRQLEERRAATVAAVELIRKSAHGFRLPNTLAELYASLISLPRKSADAQRADFAWHALAGVQPLAMHRWQGDGRDGSVELTVGGVAFVLGKVTVESPALSFEEFTLRDGDGEMLARVRIRLAPDRTASADSVVTACRPGPWIGRFTELRTRMDERRETVLLKTRYRDVAQLRSDFGIADGDPPSDSLRP